MDTHASDYAELWLHFEAPSNGNRDIESAEVCTKGSEAWSVIRVMIATGLLHHDDLQKLEAYSRRLWTIRVGVDGESIETIRKELLKTSTGYLTKRRDRTRNRHLAKA